MLWERRKPRHLSLDDHDSTVTHGKTQLPETVCLVAWHARRCASAVPVDTGRPISETCRAFRTGHFHFKGSLE